MARVSLSSVIMGLNSRNAGLVKLYNSSESMRLVKSKIRFKKVLEENGIDAPAKLHVVTTFRGLATIPWEELEGRDFVIKPDRGSGGEGILVLRWDRKKHSWTQGGMLYGQEEIRRHVRDILDGRYSSKNLPDRVLFEEMVYCYTRFFRALAPTGLPDIRVIVFNQIPLMAMVRIPTIRSGGKANLHAGGLGIGVDIGSGVTTNAVHNDQLVATHPDTLVRLADLKVPRWGKILDVAIAAQKASGLGFAGIDIVISKTGRVMVLEANSRPGLGIQLANMAGLNERVNRVKNLKVRSAEHGIRIARELFGEVDLHRITTRQRPIIRRIQEVTISRPDDAGGQATVFAKIDTGAWATSISFEVAEKIGYKRLLTSLKNRHVFDNMTHADARLLRDKIRQDPFYQRLTDIHVKLVKSANGASVRLKVPVRLQIGRSIIHTQASIADRSTLKYPVIVGAVDLQGFFVDTVMKLPKELRKKK